MLALTDPWRIGDRGVSMSVNSWRPFSDHYFAKLTKKRTTMSYRTLISITALLAVGLLLTTACSEQAGITGDMCEADDDCYPDMDVDGEPICFTDVQDGYCSHTCETDDDCCAVDGQCPDGVDFICTGFEERPDKYCFIKCTADGGTGGDQSICDEYSDDLECRNTGTGVGSPGSQACLPPG